MDIHPRRLNILDCFSGYGGFALGLRLAYPDASFRTVAYIEWDKYCQQVIQARIGDRLLDDAPIWGGDIREFNGKLWRGTVDIVTASFPCQPFSNAGKREGEFDSKGRNLWPDTLRIIREVAPRTGVLLENVPGILVRPDDGREAYGGTVVGELAEIGYDAEWRVVSAADAGAPHLRNRWWLLACPVEHSQHDGLPLSQEPASVGP